MKNSELLTKRFEKNIAGTLNCFDRLVLFGTYQPICYPQAMSWQLHEAGIQLIDYEKKFANKLRLEMTARIKAIVAQENIPIKQVYASVRKQALVATSQFGCLWPQFNRPCKSHNNRQRKMPPEAGFAIGGVIVVFY